MIKCPLVTIHMPRCNLLNVIFARQQRYLWFLHFQILKSRQICGFHCTFKSEQCFSFRGFLPPPWSPNEGLCSWTSLHLFDAHNWITVDIWPTQRKIYCPLRALAPVSLLLPLSKLQIPSAAYAAGLRNCDDVTIFSVICVLFLYMMFVILQ